MVHRDDDLVLIRQNLLFPPIERITSHRPRRIPARVSFIVGSEGAHRSAGPRPPLKPDVQFSRIRLSQRCVSDVMPRKESVKQD